VKSLVSTLVTTIPFKTSRSYSSKIVLSGPLGDPEATLPSLISSSIHATICSQKISPAFLSGAAAFAERTKTKVCDLGEPSSVIINEQIRKKTAEIFYAIKRRITSAPLCFLARKPDSSTIILVQLCSVRRNISRKLRTTHGSHGSTECAGSSRLLISTNPLCVTNWRRFTEVQRWNV
jgi:hypothetical protein